MNTREMVYEFQSMAEAAVPLLGDIGRMSSDKILLTLNIAYRRFLLNRYFETNSTTNRYGILTLQDAKNELSNLIKISSLPIEKSTGSYGETGYESVLPTDFYYPLRCDVKVNRLDEIATLESNWENIRFADSYSEFDKSMSTKFNSPVLRKPVGILTESSLIFVTDRWTSIDMFEGITFTYIRTPKNLGFENTEVSTTIPEIIESLHEELVRYAYEMWMNNISYIAGVNSNTNKHDN